jgi:hypothetical protein
MKTNQIDVVAFTIFRHFEQIEHIEKTGLWIGIMSRWREPTAAMANCQRTQMGSLPRHSRRLPPGR